jgi:hypothetical protein
MIKHDHGLLGNDASESEATGPSTSTSTSTGTPSNSTQSGRSVRLPRRFGDYYLPEMPSKENRNLNPPQAVVDPISHPDPDSLGIRVPGPAATGVEKKSESHAASDEYPLDNLEPVTTTNNADCFGVYHRIYARKRPLHDPLQCSSLNMHCDSDAHTLDPPESSSDCRPRTAPNQGPLIPSVILWPQR